MDGKKLDLRCKINMRDKYLDPLRTFHPENDIEGQTVMNTGQLPFYYFRLSDMDNRHFCFLVIVIKIENTFIYEIWLMNSSGTVTKKINEFSLTKEERDSYINDDNQDYIIIHDFLHDQYLDDIHTLLSTDF